jgi:hypothetical protein
MPDLLSVLLNLMQGNQSNSTQQQAPTSNTAPSAAWGEVSFTFDQVMAGHGGISPTNPPDFSTTVRSFPIENAPEYKTREQADQMVAAAKEKKEGARNSVRYYKALGQIEGYDAVVHTAHRAYLGEAAKAELVKKRADVKLARLLHAQRPAYAALSASLENADRMAQARIGQVRQIQGAQLSAFQQRLQASTQQRMAMLQGSAQQALPSGNTPRQAPINVQSQRTA